MQLYANGARDDKRQTKSARKSEQAPPSPLVVRFVFVSLLLIMVSLAAGCGRWRAIPTPEPITLNFAARSRIADYASLAGQFHQLHPDVNIHLVDVDVFRGRGLDALDTMEIDVVRWGQDYLTTERSNQLLPLDDVILADESFPYQDLYPGALEALQVQGIQRGIPAGLDFAVAYYNAPRFQAAGVTPPTPDWTPDDLLAAAMAVRNTEAASVTATEFTYGFCTVPNSADPIYFTYLFGGRLFDRLPDPIRPILDDPMNIEAIQWYINLHLEYGVAPDPEEIRKYFPRGGIFEAIVRGKCGLWFGQYSDRGGRAWPAEWQGQGVMLPLPRGRAPFGLIQVDGYYILAQSKHRQQAWEWVRFLLDHPEAAGLMLPPLPSQARSPEYVTRVGEEVAAVARRLPSEAMILPTATDPVLAQTVELYLNAVAQALTGDISVEVVLNEAQIQAERLFE